ncbi:hypothetical protein FZEAL_2713 [Fusarium zealandicum]|uniref:Uncharacterized protein n=1 Tax=Fusarium zealandicum TaxID=1053134 RepID=A0A8H4XNL1_9HYPO|nr:hypothetical protein FZEAL_2713 [Fusarium zealandicum]
MWRSIYEELIRTRCGDEQMDSDEVLRLKRRFEEVDEVVKAKTRGGLRLGFAPTSNSTVKSRVFWEGEEKEEESRMKQLAHKSLGLYHRKTYTQPSPSDNGEQDVLLDAEGEPDFAGLIPGTVTVDGFSHECRELAYSSKTSPVQSSRIPTKDLTPIKESSILRRIDEMKRGIHLYERSEEQEEADLKEFTGDAIQPASLDKQANPGSTECVSKLHDLLDCTDVFTNLTTKESISSEWASSKNANHDKWHLLWQIILAKELAIRLERPLEAPRPGFSRSVLAALTVQDLWFQNVEVVMEEMSLALSGVRKLAATGEVKSRAADHKKNGDDAMKNERWKDAKELYTKAIELDLSSAMYRAARSVADLRLGDWKSAAQDALIATRLDPKNTHAWNMLGASWKMGGNHVRALAAYERAVQAAGSEATNLMRQDLMEMKDKIGSLTSPQNGQDQLPQGKALKALGDQQWETFLHPTRLQSNCHEAQLEGLLCFAKQMKWPYLDELRDYSKDAWKKTTTGAISSCLVQDWLLGLTLPGKWMALKVMSCLVEMSPSIPSPQATDCFDHGYALPQCSYWRSRSVLGRILGAWQGVTELCGWVGPCPPIVLDRPTPKKKTLACVLVDAKTVHLPKSPVTDHDPYTAYWGPRADEDLWVYSDEMRNDKSWVVLQPPAQELKPVAVKAIRLKQVSSSSSSSSSSPPHDEHNIKYRASIEFSFVIKKIVPLTKVVSYALLTSPIFVSLPPCRGGTSDGHAVHVREIQRDTALFVPVHQMKEIDTKNSEGRLIVINAACEGGEIMARACHHKGLPEQSEEYMLATLRIVSDYQPVSLAFKTSVSL